MTHTITAVAAFGTLCFSVFLLKLRLTSLIRKARSAEDIRVISRGNLSVRQSKLLEEWIYTNSREEGNGPADLLTPRDWRQVEQAACPGTPLKDVAQSRRLSSFRRAVAQATDAGAVLALARENGPITESMEEAASRRLGVLRVSGPAYVWHWLDLVQYAKYPGWSESEIQWRYEAGRGLREWQHPDILRFLAEARVREKKLEPKWEEILLQRLRFALLDDDQFELVETVALLNDFEALLHKLFNQAPPPVVAKVLKQIRV